MKSQSRNVYLNLGMAWRAKKPWRLNDQTRTEEKQGFKAQHGRKQPTNIHFKCVKEETTFQSLWRELV